MGIKPPKGVILYGVPGTGKTLLAKAVANQTSATFLRIVGSELIQKYLGDGPKLVREVFRVAEQHAPSIVFIDEIDSFLRERTKGDHEVTGMMKAEFMTCVATLFMRSPESVFCCVVSGTAYCRVQIAFSFSAQLIVQMTSTLRSSDECQNGSQ